MMAGKHAECRDHRPVQHRDGKPPWCRKCGRTANGDVPISVFDRATRNRG